MTNREHILILYFSGTGDADADTSLELSAYEHPGFPGPVPIGYSTPTRTSAASASTSSASPAGSPANIQHCVPLPQDWASTFQIPWSKVHKEIRSKLDKCDVLLQ